MKRNEVVDRATEELLKLAGDVEGEEWSTVCDSLRAENRGEGEGEDDNVEGWVDERALMTENDLEELDDALQPVQFLLTKVSRIIKYQCILSNHNLTIDSKIRIRCQELLDPHSPPMVSRA